MKGREQIIIKREQIIIKDRAGVNKHLQGQIKTKRDNVVYWKINQKEDQ